MFSLFAEGDIKWVDVVSYVESAVVGVSICICDRSGGFVLGYL